jgi:hypothetical protein
LKAPKASARCAPTATSSNSGELIHQVRAPGWLGLRSTWDIGPELKSGELQVVLPQYRGSSNVAIYAVYPCREFMPAKVNVFIEFLAELYGPEPYWGLTSPACGRHLSEQADQASASARGPYADPEPRRFSGARGNVVFQARVP